MTHQMDVSIKSFVDQANKEVYSGGLNEVVV